SARTDAPCSTSRRTKYRPRSWSQNPRARSEVSSQEIPARIRVKSVRGSSLPRADPSRETCIEASSPRPGLRTWRSAVPRRTRPSSSSSAIGDSRRSSGRCGCDGEPTNLPATHVGSGPSEAWRKAEADPGLPYGHDGEAPPRPRGPLIGLVAGLLILVDGVNGIQLSSVGSMLGQLVGVVLGVAILLASLLIYRSKYSSGGILDILLGVVALVLHMNSTGGILAIVAGVG